MPPRYAYWTILLDEQPTAFRSALQEDLLPTLKRLQDKHPSARMVWFQNGKIWASRLDAQEAMRARGELGRRGDTRQRGGFRDRKAGRDPGSRIGGPDREKRDPSGKLDWQPRGEAQPPRERRPDWKPKGDSVSTRDRKPRFEKPAWQPKAAGARAVDRKSAWKPKGGRGADAKLEWRPKGAAPPGPHVLTPSRPRRPRADAKPDARRDKTWRPGGEHKDPRQKYKDAKKAKWTRFKQTVRKRWESKQGRKKKDE
jgi:hypothetical protein